VEIGNKKFNGSEVFDRADITKLVQLALSNQACTVQCPKSIRGRRGSLVPEAFQVNTDLPDLQDPRELKEIEDPKESRDLQGPKALKDLRAIQANLSRPLQLWDLRYPW